MKEKTKYGLIGDIVEIEWRDSSLNITQCNASDTFTAEVIKSIGELVKVENDCVVIAGDILKDGEIRRVIVIPEENIINY